MIDWIWQHIIGTALNGLLTSQWGLIAIIIAAALALGWAWKTFGWQGLVAVGAAVAGLFIYRKGWKDRDSLSTEHVSGPDALPPISKPVVKRPKKRATKPKIGENWFDSIRRGGKF